jgi:hypothetical protein
LEAADIYTEIKPTRIYYYMLRYYPNTHITSDAYQEGWITPEKHEDIMNGNNAQSFAMGGDLVNAESIKYQMLFSLIDLLPKTLSKMMINKQFYRKFPAFLTPPLIMILRNIFAMDLNARLLRASAIHRYFYFIAVKLRLEFLSLFRPSENHKLLRSRQKRCFLDENSVC